MINPSAGPLPEVPIPIAPEPEPSLMGSLIPEPPLPINIQVSEEEQKEIVTICNRFKRSMREYAKEKKRIMRDSYAYSKSKFIGNDLLPLPAADGDDKSLNSNRPQVFIPKTRQLVKTLYSYLKLTLFPNDEDYFRVRGKTAQAAMIEDQLTDGMKYIFKEALITTKLGAWVLNLVSMSNAACLPTIKDEIIYEWQLNPASQQYEAIQIDTPPMPDLENLNPLHFYIDPKATDPERAKWGYFGQKKKQEMKDSHFYMNTDDSRMERLATKNIMDQHEDEVRTFEYADLKSQYEDIEDSVDYDLYYFPFLKTKGMEYRNMLVGVAGEELLVRLHPNVFPRGMNPAVFQTWMPDPQSPYGIGPVEDAMQLQRLINMIYNYTVELLARIGNRFVVDESADLSALWGIAGGVITSKDPKSIQALTGDYAEPAALMNFCGTLAAELQQVGGSSNPFQGASNVDFKKTATELQILQENSISVIREVVEHVAVGVQRVLERLMYLCADTYKQPIEIRVDDPVAGPTFQLVDFSVLKSGQFTIELVNVNPSQSKQAQVETLTEVIGLVAGNPMVLPILEPILNKISQLEGIKDGPQMLREMIMRAQGVMAANAAQQSGVQDEEAGVESSEEPGMAGASPTPA